MLNRAVSRAVSVCMVAALGLAAGLAPAAMAEVGAGMAPEGARRTELVRMVRQDCGSCHGLTLAGGLGPALTVPALADKPADALVATVLGGRHGTAMPPFASLLSEAEAVWIVEALQRGFPPDPGPQPQRP